MRTRKAGRLLEHATAIARLDNELALRRAEFERLASTENASTTMEEQGVSRKSEHLLQVAAVIVRLESDLALRRGEFERLLSTGRKEPQGASPPEGERTQLALRPLARTSSLPVRVQSALDLSTRPLTAHDIAAQISEPIDSVRAALSKLYARGTVDRVTAGVYRSTNAGHRRAAGEDD